MSDHDEQKGRTRILIKSIFLLEKETRTKKKKKTKIIGTPPKFKETIRNGVATSVEGYENMF